jgi:hypothetical protein
MKNLKDGLTVFLDDPRVPIDNNQTERALWACPGSVDTRCS